MVYILKLAKEDIERLRKELSESHISSDEWIIKRALGEASPTVEVITLVSY